MFLSLDISSHLLSGLRSKPVHKSSLSLALLFSLYIKETIWARLVSSKCFPQDVVNLKVLKKAIGPRITDRKPLSFPYLDFSAFSITSKFN